MGGRKFFHALSMPTSTRNPEFPAELVVRLACHLIIDHIPDSGLFELCETANDLFEFYSQRESATEAGSLPTLGIPVAGTVVGTIQRPAFSIQDE